MVEVEVKIQLLSKLPRNLGIYKAIVWNLEKKIQPRSEPANVWVGLCNLGRRRPEKGTTEFKQCTL